MGLRQLCPFQFCDNYVLGARHEKSKALRVDQLTTAELLVTEGARFTNDQVDLPACCQIDHVKQGLPPMRFEGGIQISIVFATWQGLDESSQLFRIGCDHNVNVLGRPRSAVVSAGERSSQHVSNSSPIQCRADSPENFRCAHGIPGGSGAGKNASLSSSRATRACDHSGCSRRIPSLASSRANKLISKASSMRCSPDIAR